jgi:hypothetical protein
MLSEFTTDRLNYQMKWLKDSKHSQPKFVFINSRNTSTFEVTGKYTASSKSLSTIQRIFEVNDGFIVVSFFSNQDDPKESNSEFYIGLESVRIKSKNLSFQNNF